MRIVFEQRTQLAPKVWRFAFRPERPVDFIAGQYSEIHLPHKAVDARGDRRWFTLSSTPGEPLLTIVTKIVTGESSSFKRALFNLSPGAILHMGEPMGDFVLPKNPRIPLVFAAGGVGITPVYSMVAWLNHTSETRRIILLYAVRSPEDFIFAELFQRPGLTFVPIVRQPHPKWQGETGVLTGERLIDFAWQLPDALFYFSGPQPMVESLIEQLKLRGLPSGRIVMDYFPGYDEL